MTPGQQLKEEHEGILLMLDILGKASEKLKRKEKVDITHLGQMAEFFKIFADRCHHGKEEGLLFPELEKAGIHGPIGVMLAEHVQGRGFIQGMKETLAGLKKGDTIDPGCIGFKTPGDISSCSRSTSGKKTTFFFPWVIESSKKKFGIG